MHDVRNMCAAKAQFVGDLSLHAAINAGAPGEPGGIVFVVTRNAVSHTVTPTLAPPLFGVKRNFEELYLSLDVLTRRVRNSLGLKQEAFAARLGAATSSVRNWEKGRKRPSPEYLKKMAELAPSFAEQVESAIAGYEWHPTQQSGRYSQETVAVLHQALDMILDRAPSEAVQKITEFLEAFAGKWGDHPQRGRKSRLEPHLVPAELDTEITRIAEQRGLDTSAILRDALSLGLDALSRSAAAQRQVKINKEAHRRAHPRSA